MTSATDPSQPLGATPATPNANEYHNDFWHTLRARRSIRRYEQRPLSQALLMQLLDAARWAPSAHNRQPWRFCVVTDEALKDRLACKMGDSWRRDLGNDGMDSDVIERRVSISHSRLTSAAALVLACVSMEGMDVYGDPARDQAEWTMAVQSVALACQNLLLAAQHEGLGACWMCAPLFAPDLLRAVLDLPKRWQPQALITLGYPAETREKEREPLESRVLWR